MIRNERGLLGCVWIGLAGAAMLTGCQANDAAASAAWDNPRDPANAAMIGMRAIETGTFEFGAFGALEPDPQEISYLVGVSSFLIDTTEVTRGHFRNLMGWLPASNGEDCQNCPVGDVTWFDAVVFCNARSKRGGFDTVYSWISATRDSLGSVVDLAGFATDETKDGFRLPFEVEWEWASRGGLESRAWPWGDDSASVDFNAWSKGNAREIAKSVATKRPNGYGLYDMAGNVWEMVGDRYAAYDSLRTFDPRGPSTGDMVVFRGGSSADTPRYLACAMRGGFELPQRSPLVGFRCARKWVY